MTTRYAQNTTVNVDRSRVEVHRLLRKHGATRVADAWEPGRAAVQFEIHGRVARLAVPLPTTAEVAARPRARKAPAALRKAVEREERQRWRALVLLLKAKLESIELGLTTFDDEFLAALVLKDGSTMGESIARSIEDGATRLLPAKGEGKHEPD